MAFISADFDAGVSCSSISVFKGIAYDVVHTRREQIMWDGSVQDKVLQKKYNLA